MLHWEANGSSSWGFNASVGSARCGSGGPGSCPVPQECVPQDGAEGAGLCRCPQGWAGPHCRMALCPENCHAHSGAGTCNQVRGQDQRCGLGRSPLRGPPESPVALQSLGVCICAEGFGGPDCATKLDGGQLVWETLMDSRLSAVSGGLHLDTLHPTPHWPLGHSFSAASHMLPPCPRTRPAASCTAWDTPWWKDLKPLCGCLGVWACPRGCWETCTGEEP